MRIEEIWNALDLPLAGLKSGERVVRSPVDGEKLAGLRDHTAAELDMAIERSVRAFRQWREVPAPVRGELVRLFGEVLRENKIALGRLISLECGKILSEGEGEVQEMIDICDFAVGLSRQLYGLTIASERPGHHLRETWHPMGPVGVISAFNFPMAVWAWNATLAWVCGDTVIWKPSEKTPLCALACARVFELALERYGKAPEGLLEVVIGDRELGEKLVDDPRVPIISATGSCAMGRAVGQRVAARFGRAILELGGNNAAIVTPSADLDLALRAIVFGAVGTAGQRCTTTRRVFAHTSVADTLIDKLEKAYAQLRIGSPLEASTLVGPLIDEQAFLAMQAALADAREKGCRVIGGERVLEDVYPDAWYVQPAIVIGGYRMQNVQTETFAPILYIFRYEELDDAIARQNDVPQGLSSAIFTTDLREAEYFTSAVGSDCGLANVNAGTSGAEIGGAFGGEKETGGGRESGSDAWKGYMRRQTNTINYSRELPLAQGIEFNL